MSDQTLSARHGFVVGPSVRMRAVLQFLESVSQSDNTVLITGESGTGKEVTASFIHQSSRRRPRPFVAVSCALFSESLIESELFGHERGAFTGAVRDRVGRFELADGGTLFLDDIDDVPVSMQVKLLRVLQSRTIERLGGARPVPIDVRVVAGTKRDLRQMVSEGRFREDLFYRLNVPPITLPPLRDRREDIPQLMDHFLARATHRDGGNVLSVPDYVYQVFARYDWPGNVRELENMCERLMQICQCGTVGAGCLAIEMLSPLQPPDGVAPFVPVSLPEEPAPIELDQRLRDLESTLISWALEKSKGNKSKAAELLTIKRSTLGDRINRCGLGEAQSRLSSPTPADRRPPGPGGQPSTEGSMAGSSRGA